MTAKVLSGATANNSQDGAREQGEKGVKAMLVWWTAIYEWSIQDMEQAFTSLILSATNGGFTNEPSIFCYKRLASLLSAK